MVNKGWGFEYQSGDQACGGVLANGGKFLDNGFTMHGIVTSYGMKMVRPELKS